MILVYYVSQIVVLFVENALRDVALVNIAFKSVHLITGIVIMVPVLLLSFVPLFVDLQTRMLFNEDFSQRYDMTCMIMLNVHQVAGFLYERLHRMGVFCVYVLFCRDIGGVKGCRLYVPATM